MNTGDTFIDGQKCTWTLTDFLGQGTWGRSFRARSSQNRECVLKVALSASDFPADTPVSDTLIRACRDAAREQIQRLQSDHGVFKPRLLSSLTLPGGVPALMLAHYSHTIESGMGGVLELTEVVELMERVASGLAKSDQLHGNLRPSNILINERGEPVLSDALTPALQRVFAELERLAPNRARWRPPEITVEPEPQWDSWAVCQVLYQAAMHRADASEPRPARAGLDKVEIATLRDRAQARMAHERTNARFRSRLAERLGAVLHRGLSLEREPSPPYRFTNCAALAPRLAEVSAMVSPQVVDVGRVLLTSADHNSVFRGDEEITFSISVGCSAGVTNHEDVVCGLQLQDLDSPEGNRIRVDEAQYKVERHRSGRLRFQFTIPDIVPGRYRVKVAFSVRDTGDTPEVALGEFEIRPAPGYVPPARDLQSTAPIMLDRVRPLPTPEPQAITPVAFNEDAPSSPGEITLSSDPGAEVIEGLFPRPIAPPSSVDEVLPAMGGFVARDQPVVPPAQPAPPLTMPNQAVVNGGLGPRVSLGSATAAANTGPMMMPMASIGPSIAPAPAGPAQPALTTPSEFGANWWSSHPDDIGIGGDGLLPGMHSDGEDLPSWKGETLGQKLRSLPGTEFVLEWVQRDTYTAFVAAFALSFVLLLTTMAILRAF